MPSILIIEDGTGRPTANSYVDAAAARTYAANRGVTLPVAGSGIDPVEILLLKAAQFLDGLSFVGIMATKGLSVANTQALAWPRVLTWRYLNYPWMPFNQYLINCGPFDSSYFVLPQKVKDAQSQLVLEQQMNGVVLDPTTLGGPAGQFITREKVDVIETSYSERLGTLDTPTIRTVNNLLRELLVAGGIRTVRV